MSAGLTGAINLETFIGAIPEGSALTQSLLGAVDFSGGLTVANLLNGAIDSVITSGLSSIVHGTDFGETLSSSLMNMAINLALADVQNGIGDITQSLGLGEGSPAHMLMHALAGCAAAAAQQGSCAAGAAGGIAQSLFAGSLDGSAPERGDYASDQAWQQARQDWMGEVTRMAAVIGAIPGFLLSGGDANNVTLASSIAQSGIANNYLSHVERTERDAAREACRAGDADACDRMQELNDLDQDRDEFLDDCRGVSSPACSQARVYLLITAAEYIDAMNTGAYGELGLNELVGRQLIYVEAILNVDPDDVPGLDPILRSQFKSAQTEYSLAGTHAERQDALRDVLALGTMLAPHIFQAGRGMDPGRWTRHPVLNPTQRQIDAANRLGVDVRWVTPNGTLDYPPNDGFAGVPVNETLPVGTRIDRYGGNDGSFFAPSGIPFDQRAMPGPKIGEPNQFVVLKPLPTQSGLAVPWFDKPGGGTQYKTGNKAQWLLDNGFIDYAN